MSRRGSVSFSKSVVGQISQFVHRRTERDFCPTSVNVYGQTETLPKKKRGRVVGQFQMAKSFYFESDEK
jgi:hypothetical protein